MTPKTPFNEEKPSTVPSIPQWEATGWGNCPRQDNATAAATARTARPAAVIQAAVRRRSEAIRESNEDVDVIVTACQTRWATTTVRSIDQQASVQANHRDRDHH
jgi:hypothetical protein